VWLILKAVLRSRSRKEPHLLVGAGAGAGAVTRCSSGSGNGIYHGLEFKMTKNDKKTVYNPFSSYF
jgi:hypothetical protein